MVIIIWSTLILYGLALTKETVAGISRNPDVNFGIPIAEIKKLTESLNCLNWLDSRVIPAITMPANKIVFFKASVVFVNFSNCS